MNVIKGEREREMYMWGERGVFFQEGGMLSFEVQH